MAKLSSRTIVTTANNSDYFHIIQDNGAGGFTSKQISKLNFLKELQAKVDAISTIGDTGTISVSDQSGTVVTLTHSLNTINPIIIITDSTGNNVNIDGNWDNNSGSTTSIRIDFHTDITHLGTCNYRIL